MVSVSTYTATIYVGLREGYTSRIRHADEVEALCQEYCDEVGLCVTLTPTKFVYTEGQEPGVAVGLMHCGRFPHDDPKAVITDQALKLAARLKSSLGQLRLSIVFPDVTLLLGE